MEVHDNSAKPILIYDGECGFCKYSVDYWQKLTGNSVEYKPYQAVASDYPSISIDEFKHAIRYIAPDGKVAKGAEASFLTLSHAKGRGIWLKLYRHLPGFAFISEKAYVFVAAHRPFFYFLSILLWGKHCVPPSYNLIAWLFLRGLGLIFLAAFLSFAVQASALIGSQGIIPVAELTAYATQQFGAERYWLLPMLFWVNTSDLFIQIICWGGALISLLLVFNILPRVSLLLLYLCYLSLVCAAQVFMSFQWDMYLLETALIAFFLVAHTTLAIWLLRWLVFRFIFAGGMVKIMSGDPSWWDLTALNYHFYTQPLPTPLAWYAQQLPTAFLKFTTAAALFIELVMPFFIFFPRHLRFLAAFFILLMQFAILITGNYNWFNIQTILLCLVLFDDAAIAKILPTRLVQFILNNTKYYHPKKIFNYIAYAFAIFTVFISIVQFKLRFWGNVSAASMYLQNAIEPLRMTNTYGPFAIMTKDRMEIIIEGSNDGQNWQEYQFRYKPGDVNRRPPWNIPHQPRVDWQMWFAALGSVNENPWFVRFLVRILQNSPPVVALFDYNPFPDAAPRYLRAQFYAYRFTDREERKQSGAWWTRRLVGEYYPVVNLN